MTLFSIFLFSLVTSSEPAIVGNWKCDPYLLKGESYEASITETTSYLADGKYTTIGISEYTYGENMKVTVEVHFDGQWKQEPGFITRRTASAKVVKTNVDWLSVDQMQSVMDKSLKVDEWTKYQLSFSEGRMHTKRVSADRPELNIDTICAKT